MAARIPEALGRYQIVGELGVGGMAEIFLARLTGPNSFERAVVIKRILPHLARQESFVAMFLDEARIVARIRHRNVVQVHELCHEDGELFMVMEYLEGESVASLCQGLTERAESLPPALAAFIASEACAGLHAAHEMTDDAGAPLNVVHRDVSPQNVLVTYDGEVKVLDFGVAKAAGRMAHTQTGLLKGKLAYMSPEQGRHEPLDRRSDVFSLGAVLFELLTGRALFERATELDTLRAITAGPILPPSRLRASCPAPLDAICQRALARDPAGRYGTADEMRRDLLAYIRESGADEPDRALAALMQAVFPDRRERKRSMLQSIRSRPAATPPPGEVSRTVATEAGAATAAARPARRPRRGLVRAAGLALAAGALAAAAAWMSRSGSDPGDAPAPAIAISNFRAAWSTANGIRWEWDVNDAPPDRFGSYELVVGPTEADTAGRTARAVVWDASKNPELGLFILPRTNAADRVLGTITFGHPPSTDHYGQLIATDHAGRRSVSPVVRARTTMAVEEATVVPEGDCPPCYTQPDWFRRSAEGALRGECYAGLVCCDLNPDPAARVCDRVSACYHNLRVSGMPPRPEQRLALRLQKGSFLTTAFLEFQVANESALPSTWSEIWIWVGPPDCGESCSYRYRALVLPATGRYHLVQIPLRVLSNPEGRLLTYEELRERDFWIRQFNVGGNWSAGARVRIDEVRLRW